MKFWAWSFVCLCYVVLLWMPALSILSHLRSLPHKAYFVSTQVLHSLRYLDGTQEIINNLRPILLRDQSHVECFWPIWSRGNSVQEVKGVVKVRVRAYRVSGNFLRHVLKQVFLRSKGRQQAACLLLQAYMRTALFPDLVFLHMYVFTYLEAFSLIYAKSY